MIVMTFVLEDTIIHAERGNSHWHVTLSDGSTGKHARATWTDTQFAAVMALAIGIGDPGYDTDKLYEVAEDAIKDFPAEIRPIP